ncbi:MAG: sigma-54 dependent transcriptional regulator [Rikenellaceae bacterium]|jgi:DNA-binding NtrC family response regulator|nr:sigma-54 dependent transcriptional regulator [Rikenellaceae bacterium]
MAKILVIDDERSVRNTLKDVLEYEGHQVDVAEDGNEGILKSKKEEFDFVLCDTKYARIGDNDMIATIHEEKPDTHVMMTSRDLDLDRAVECMKRGASDFIAKPINLNRLLNSIKESLDRELTDRETARKGGPIGRKGAAEQFSSSFDSMKGRSPQMLHVKRLIEKVAPSEARVLILGGNGTGKELVAHSLHEKSPRSSEPFVEVNCAAIPSELIESELFGHEKGAFTSAHKQRKGKFEQADGGTLFLDEIGDMSLDAQAKVLRALQEGRISRVGSDKDIEVNVRVVAATNKNLRDEIEKRTFREDLYHRLSVIVIRVPSLSERKEDIPDLVDAFLDQVCTEYKCERKEVDPEAMAELQSIQWTGNIRQLRNVIERLVILSGDVITTQDIRSYAQEIL